MKAACLLATLLAFQFLGAAQTPHIARALEPFPGPQAYKATKSGTILYVETDGRHLAAISSDGKLLWNRDPFKDAHLKFYRTQKPQIVYLGPSPQFYYSVRGQGPDDFVRIVFNNSQFGLVRISNGDFKFLGQD